MPYLKCNVLSLPITVKPQDQPLAFPGLLLEVPLNGLLILMHQANDRIAQRSSKQRIDIIWPDLKTCMPQKWRVALRFYEAIQQDGRVRRKRRLYPRHYLHHRGPIQVDRTALPPCSPVVWEVQLHKMASHRSKHHVAGLPIDQVVKKEQRVVIGAAQASRSLVSCESRPRRACQHKVSTHGLYNKLACENAKSYGASQAMRS